MSYDLIIIGGGPAGVAAGVYAARKRLHTLLVTVSFGGQSIDSALVENWIGTPAISGPDLATALKNHLKKYEGGDLTITEGAKVTAITKTASDFEVTLSNGDVHQSRTVLLTSGSRRRKLTVPGAERYEQKGITYCASCDAPLFGDKDVVVIGGGNAGFETASQLTAYARTVTLLHKNSEFKADPLTVEKVLKNPKVTAIANADLLEVKGDNFVTGIIYKNKTTGETKEVSAQGIFAEIGHLPETSLVEKLANRNDFGAIVVDPRNGRTSQDGLWAAGDCTDGLFHQNNIAAGDAIKALEDIYNYLHLHS